MSILIIILWQELCKYCFVELCLQSRCLLGLTQILYLKDKLTCQKPSGWTPHTPQSLARHGASSDRKQLLSCILSCKLRKSARLQIFSGLCLITTGTLPAHWRGIKGGQTWRDSVPLQGSQPPGTFHRFSVLMWQDLTDTLIILW